MECKVFHWKWENWQEIENIFEKMAPSGKPKSQNFEQLFGLIFYLFLLNTSNYNETRNNYNNYWKEKAVDKLLMTEEWMEGLCEEMEVWAYGI